MENELVKQEMKIVTLQVLDVNNITEKETENLKNAKPSGVSIDEEYWSPETEGETKRLIFIGVKEQEEIPDINDKTKKVKKDCAYFLEMIQGTNQVTKCAATRLVSRMKECETGQAFDISYTGKVKNKTNNFQSSKFKIQPLIFND